MNILVVEDEENIRKLLEINLRNEGYNVILAENGRIALDIMDVKHIDLIVLDIVMPEMDGFEFTKILRTCNYTTPILMATAKHFPSDKKRGFILGTDDYITKPIDIEEMLLRIKALLRRSMISTKNILTIGNVTLNYNTLVVTKDTREYNVPQKEFELLYKLLLYPNKIFTRLQLMDEIWGLDTTSEETTVNVHINRLRKKFSDFEEFKIVSVRGLGYKGVINESKKN
nr:response regulator transcription factor [Vallitalea okinawensis]